MNVGDTVWWVGAPPTRRKVRLTADLGGRFAYRTVGGRTGWEGDDVRANFRPIGRRTGART